MIRLPYTLVERGNVKCSRPALEKAGWKCERCPSSSGLRVVVYRGATLVLCDPCRIQGSWMGSVKAVSTIRQVSRSSPLPSQPPQVRAAPVSAERAPAERAPAQFEASTLPGKLGVCGSCERPFSEHRGRESYCPLQIDFAADADADAADAADATEQAE